MAEGEVAEAESAATEGGSSDSVNSIDDVNLDSISDIPVEVSAVLGSCSMPVSQLLKLGRGAVVTLDRKVGEPIDIYVNNRMIARGEVVIVENKIGITMTEIIRSSDKD